MKLVTDGEKFAIRKWSWLFFSYRYLDLKSGITFWWSPESVFFKDCWADEKTAREALGWNLKKIWVVK